MTVALLDRRYGEEIVWDVHEKYRRGRRYLVPLDEPTLFGIAHRAVIAANVASADGNSGRAAFVDAIQAELMQAWNIEDDMSAAMRKAWGLG